MDWDADFLRSLGLNAELDLHLNGGFVLHAFEYSRDKWTMDVGNRDTFYSCDHEMYLNAPKTREDVVKLLSFLQWVYVPPKSGLES